MALEGKTVVHGAAGVHIADRVAIATRAEAAVTSPGFADRFMESPVQSRVASPQVHVPKPSRWSTPLFAIQRDCCGCIYTTLCPCLVVGRIGAFLNPPNSKYWECFSFLALWCCKSYQQRTKLRKKFNLPEVPCGDFCTHASCMCCALCQENRECSRRGVDMRWIWPKGHCGSPTCRAKHAPGQVVMHK